VLGTRFEKASEAVINVELPVSAVKHNSQPGHGPESQAVFKIDKLSSWPNVKRQR
jgi:hypothetical protein